MASAAKTHTRKAIELSAREVPQRVARQAVQREQADVEQHDDGAQPDAEVTIPIEGINCVVPKEAKKDKGKKECIAMQVLQDEWKRRLALITVASAFIYGARGGIEKEGAVIGFAVIVAS